jgi:PAS domain S-box-containing protein
MNAANGSADSTVVKGQAASSAGDSASAGWHRRWLQLRPYVLAVGAVAIAFVLAELARQDLDRMIIPLFLAAISTAIWYGGNGPGMLAIALSGALVAYFFTEPLYSFEIQSADRIYFAVFIAFALLIAWFAGKRRRIETELRTARDALQTEVEVREQQAHLLDLTHDTIFVRDMDDVITYWNLGAQELYGWRAEDAIGQSAHQLLKTVFPAPLDQIRAELLRNGRWEGEVTKTKADGTQIVVTSRWSLQRDEHGRPVAIFATNNDITLRKQGEEKIRRLVADLERRTLELESSNRELEAFAYSTSHDLRAPLRHLAGYSELLKKTAFASMDEKSQRYVTMIQESAQRMGTLIDDLLTFSRIGRAETHNTLVNLGQLTTEILKEIEAETEGREIVWKIGALPSIYGDRAMLRLALVNLLGNAVKFTRTRAPAVIEIGSMPATADHVTVFVKDNGVGFDMKYVKKLFGVFQRLHGAESFEGTGIGLATVQRIIARHGGRVWAEGAVGEGATFYFSAPAL